MVKGARARVKVRTHHEADKLAETVTATVAFLPTINRPYRTKSEKMGSKETDQKAVSFDRESLAKLEGTEGVREWTKSTKSENWLPSP